MMYNKETIKKVTAKLVSAIKECRSHLADLHVCVSNGNKKIGKVMNVSLAPIITCSNCSQCKNYCYDIKAVLQYRNTVLPARARNTALAMYDRQRFFAEIDTKMSRRKKNKFFRWHVSGDIIDMNYLENMIDLAKKHPDFVIWTYTKNYAVVNEYVRTHGGSVLTAIPSNFSIMFSKWDGMPMNNEYNFPVFACKLADGNKDLTDADFNKMYACTGNCDICKELKTGCPYRVSSYVNEH